MRLRNAIRAARVVGCEYGWGGGCRVRVGCLCDACITCECVACIPRACVACASCAFRVRRVRVVRIMRIAYGAHMARSVHMRALRVGSSLGAYVASCALRALLRIACVAAYCVRSVHVVHCIKG